MYTILRDENMTVILPDLKQSRDLGGERVPREITS